MEKVEKALSELLTKPDATNSGFWQTVVDTMSEALIVVGTDRRILYFNKEAEDLTGLSLDQARGKLCVDAISCPQCQCACLLFEQGKVDGREVTVYTPQDGKKRTLLKNGRLLKNDQGEVIGGVETFKDITAEASERSEKQQRIEALFMEKKRYEALIGSLSQGVFSIDENYRVLEFSSRMAELTGYSEADARGANVFHLLGITRLQPAAKGLASLPETTHHGELRCRDGRFLGVQIQFRSIRFSDHEILGLVQPLAAPSKVDLDTPTSDAFQGIVSRSAAMRSIFSLVESTASSDINILIEGESGTGKELIARAIHRLSDRADQPFYAVNCATFTGSLLLSELFGHERGAFTGAVRQKAGKLELAGRGTLFLDEVSEIPIQHQALLLRVLEERTFERLGGQAPIDMRSRILAATNRNLSEALQAGTFREDLYYRLKVVPIRVPPLRERPEDIEPLATSFLEQSSRASGDPLARFTPEAMEALLAYRWPGNVRELRNLIEYLSFTAGTRIGLEDLPAELLECARSSGRGLRACSESQQAQSERQEIVQALRRANFKRARAARLLGIDRSTLYRKMKKLSIDA